MKPKVLFILLVSLTSCDVWSTLELINDSDQTIYVSTRWSPNPSISSLFSRFNDDTDYPIRKYYRLTTIYPHSVSFIHAEMGASIDYERIQNGLSVFIFDSLSIYKIPYNQVVKENLIMARYYVGPDHFYDRFPLHFPPTPDMQDIEMWPPYEEVVEKYSPKD